MLAIAVVSLRGRPVATRRRALGGTVTVRALIIARGRTRRGSIVVVAAVGVVLLVVLRRGALVALTLARRHEEAFLAHDDCWSVYMDYSVVNDLGQQAGSLNASVQIQWGIICSGYESKKAPRLAERAVKLFKYQLR